MAERFCNFDELPRSHRKAGHGRIRFNRDFEVSEQLPGIEHQLPAIHNTEAVYRMIGVDILGDGKVVGQAEFLVNDRNALAARVARADKHGFHPMEENAASGWWVHAGENL